MSGIVRTIVSRFRVSIGDRRAEARIKVRLGFTISTPKATAANNQAQVRFKGHTLDISANSVGLVFHSVQIETYYLIVDGRPLNLILELPSGPVRMLVAPVRNERLGDSESKCAYLIGARIKSMSEEDRQRYLTYLLPRLTTKSSAT